MSFLACRKGVAREPWRADRKRQPCFCSHTWLLVTSVKQTWKQLDLFYVPLGPLPASLTPGQGVCVQFHEESPLPPTAEATQTDTGFSQSFWVTVYPVGSRMIFIFTTLNPSSLPNCSPSRLQAPVSGEKTTTLQRPFNQFQQMYKAKCLISSDYT